MADKPEFNGWAHAKQSVAFLAANFPSALKASGLWLVLIVGTMAAATPVLVWLVQNDPNVAAWIRSSDERLIQLIVVLPSILLMIIGWPSVAVAWHRFVLRREPPGFLPFSPGRGGLYLLLSITFYLMVWIAPGALLAYIFYTTMKGDSSARGLIGLVWLPLAVALFGLSMRFSLKLPAIAVSDTGMTFARSWKETAAIWPGMMWGSIVLTLPLYMASRALDRAAENTGEDQLELAVLLGAINMVAFFTGLLLYATFLSLTYQRAVGDTSTTFD